MVWETRDPRTDVGRITSEAFTLFKFLRKTRDKRFGQEATAGNLFKSVTLLFILTVLPILAMFIVYGSKDKRNCLLRILCLIG